MEGTVGKRALRGLSWIGRIRGGIDPSGPVTIGGCRTWFRRADGFRGERDDMAQAARVAVVGGGIGGLVAAAFAARAGAQVTLFERMSETGGRGRSRSEKGFTFNMGPHALYLGGPAMAALRELGIEPAGKSPQTSGGMGIFAGKLHALPGGAVSLLTTGLLRVSEKLELAGLLSRVPKLVAEARPDVSVGEFLAGKVRSERVRELLL